MKNIRVVDFPLGAASEVQQAIGVRSKTTKAAAASLKQIAAIAHEKY